jgi:hypothetical protein
MSASRRARLVLTVALAGSAWSPTVLAGSPTRDQCIDANEEAQDLRREGSLVEARARLAICVAPSCPGPVRDDCVERLRAVDDAMPTIVVGATEGAGAPRGVVTLDDRPVFASDAGGEIPVDPGIHRIVLAADSASPISVTVVVREGEKRRRVEAPAPAPARPGGRDVHHPLGVAVGAVGLAGLVLGGVFAALAKSTDADALRDECGGDPHACSAAGARDGATAHAQARLATVGLVGGGGLLAAGAAIYLTGPGERRLAIGPAAGAGSAGLTLKGVF